MRRFQLRASGWHNTIVPIEWTLQPGAHSQRRGLPTLGSCIDCYCNIGEEGQWVRIPEAAAIGRLASRIRRINLVVVLTTAVNLMRITLPHYK